MRSAHWIAIGVVVAIVLLTFLFAVWVLPLLLWSGFLREEPVEVLTEREYEEHAKEGVRLVFAIRACEQKTGLAPLLLTDLPPGTPVPAGWTLDWRPFSWALEKELPGRTRLVYDSDSRWEGWGVEVLVRDPEGYEVPELVIDQPRPPPPGIEPDELDRRIRREFLRRIALRPAEAIHRQGYVTWLIRAGELDAAAAEARELLSSGEQGFWALTALAYLDLVRGIRTEGPGGLPALEALADRNDDLVVFHVLATLGRKAGRLEEAKVWLAQAAEHPIRETEWTGWTFGGHAWDAATFAYELGEHEVCLALCERWIEADYHSSCVYAVRAAARLALGRVDEALADADLAVRGERKQATWAGDLDALYLAAERGDTSFRWKGQRLAPYEFLVTYR